MLVYVDSNSYSTLIINYSVVTFHRFNMTLCPKSTKLIDVIKLMEQKCNTVKVFYTNKRPPSVQQDEKTKNNNSPWYTELLQENSRFGVQVDCSDKQNKVFVVFSSWEKCFTTNFQMHASQRSAYEQLIPLRPLRLFFDWERKVTLQGLSNQDRDAFITKENQRFNALRKLMKYYFIVRLGVALLKLSENQLDEICTTVAITDSTGVTKKNSVEYLIVSRHMHFVLVDIVDTKAHKEETKMLNKWLQMLSGGDAIDKQHEAIQFIINNKPFSCMGKSEMEKLENELKENGKWFIGKEGLCDESVYGNWRCFRTIGSTKFAENRCASYCTWDTNQIIPTVHEVPQIALNQSLNVLGQEWVHRIQDTLIHHYDHTTVTHLPNVDTLSIRPSMLQARTCKAPIAKKKTSAGTRVNEHLMASSDLQQLDREISVQPNNVTRDTVVERMCTCLLQYVNGQQPDAAKNGTHLFQRDDLQIKRKDEYANSVTVVIPKRVYCGIKRAEHDHQQNYFVLNLPNSTIREKCHGTDGNEQSIDVDVHISAFEHVAYYLSAVTEIRKQASLFQERVNALQASSVGNVSQFRKRTTRVRMVPKMCSRHS